MLFFIIIDHIFPMGDSCELLTGLFSNCSLYAVILVECSKNSLLLSFNEGSNNNNLDL